ncbi:MAG TPA: FAD-dependent oxidoreductase [Kineosporiaceae bacterium]
MNAPYRTAGIAVTVLTAAALDQDVAVVGGGDSAVQEATFLTRFARSVTLVHRRGTLRASKIMQERAFADPKLTVRWNSQVVDVLGDGSVTGLHLRDTVTGTDSRLAVTGVFVAVGHEPRSALVAGQVALDAAGYIRVAHPTTATDVPGAFACGDLVDHRYRQAVTAAESDCAAAPDAERFLAGLDAGGSPSTDRTSAPTPPGTAWATTAPG